MSLTRRISACLTALTLSAFTALALAPARAQAAHGQVMTFEAPRDLLNARARPRALGQLESLGVNALRIVLYWHDVAPSPNSARRPSFDATDPTRYAWGEYDALINAAAQRHWKVLLTVSGPGPKWATKRRRDIVTEPSPTQFGQFMTAVGRHYGSLVWMFSIWNEPNHPQFLLPQFDANGTPASPRLYRALFQSGYAGLKASGLKDPQVLMGETAPTGFASTRGKHDVAPLVFLRSALCLNSQYRKAPTCSALPTAGYAHHAYTKPAGPFYVPSSRDDVTIGALSRLTRALDLAARAHAVAPNLGIYLTEFGIQSKPNKFLGVPVAQQAEFDAISERIAFYNPRVRAFSQYLLRDDPVGARPGSAAHGLGFIGFQSGLEYVTGKPKPSYYGFRTPLVVGRHGTSLWGLVRPAAGPTHVQVQVQDAGSRRFRVLASSVPTDAQGYWTLHSSDTRGRAWRVSWRTPAGAVYTGPPIRAY